MAGCVHDGVSVDTGCRASAADVVSGDDSAVNTPDAGSGLVSGNDKSALGESVGAGSTSG